MAKVKGYYNINNGVFLGPVTATNEATGIATTPRYVEGVCFGEYDTITEEFVPETNPYRTVGTMYVDESQEAFVQGKHEEHISGVEEDKGLDIARKKIHSLALGRTPNVETRTMDGQIFDSSHKVFETKSDVKTAPEKTTEEKAEETGKGRFLTKDEIPELDFESLFK